VSKETFRDALFGWLTIVAKNASEASFRYSERQTWVKDGDAAHSSMRSETLLLAQWVEAYIDSMRKVPEWTEVVEEALTWHELAEHIATNCGCVGHYGTIYADLGLLLQSFLPPIDSTVKASRQARAFRYSGLTPSLQDLPLSSSAPQWRSDIRPSSRAS